MTVSSGLWRRSLLRYLADHNPFYLLSAASMLLACLLLSNTMTWSPIALNRLLALTATLSFYELLVVGLALYLITRRSHATGLVRDGVMLLILEAFFLADVGFLSSEMYQESLRAGLLVNGLLMLLAIVKLTAIFRVLRMPLASPAFALIVATIALLLGHPAILKQFSEHHRGLVPGSLMYAGWWTLAILLAAYSITTRFGSPREFRGERAGADRAAIGHVLITIALLSVIAHLGTAHWVYKSHFEPADLSPLLLGLAVYCASIPSTNSLPRSNALLLSVLLAGASLSTASSATPALTMSFSFFTLTPLKLALAGAYLALVYAFVARHFVRYAIVGVGAFIAYTLAPSWSNIQDAGTRINRWVSDFSDRFIPRTQAAWGAIALVGAFGLLALGAALSLWRSDDEDADGGTTDEPLNDPPQIITIDTAPPAMPM